MESDKLNILVSYKNDNELNSVINSALTLSRGHSSQITLAHIGKTTDKDLSQKAKEVVQAKNIPMGIKVDFITKEGDPYSDIVPLAAQIGANSIIMLADKQAGGGFMGMFNDKDSYHTVLEAPCPVLTLTGKNELRQIKNIVIPIDLTPDTRQKIPATIALAKRENATVHVIGISEEQKGEFRTKLDRYTEQTRRYIEEHGVPATSAVRVSKHIPEAVSAYAVEINAELIIVTADDSAGGLFKTPYAMTLIMNSPTPILNVRPRDLTISWAGL